jgi:hypothetical protein
MTPPDERIANYTLWLTVVAGFQFFALILQACVMFVQSKRLKETVKATDKAANAAQDAAESLPRVEKAYVFVEIEHTAIQKIGAIGQTFIDDSQIIVNILFCNHGRTPAIIREIVIYWGNEGSAPRAYHMEIPLGSVITGNKPFKRPLQIDTPKVENFFCWGTITFEDIFRDTYTTGFHWHWDDWAECFEISNNDELNYYNKKI